MKVDLDVLFQNPLTLPPRRLRLRDLELIDADALPVPRSALLPVRLTATERHQDVGSWVRYLYTLECRRRTNWHGCGLRVYGARTVIGGDVLALNSRAPVLLPGDTVVIWFHHAKIPPPIGGEAVFQMTQHGVEYGMEAA